MNIYKLINSEWISFVSIDNNDNQSFPTNSLDISGDGSTIAIGTSHSPVNSSNYDDNYLSAGYIGYQEETGAARVYQIATSGDSNNNSIDGDSSSNFLEGHAGDDTLLGYEDIDILSGGSGNDSLNGGDGNDILLGGTDNDVLYGGRGAIN